MARGASKQNLLRDNEKRAKREEEKLESKQKAQLASGQVPRRPKRSKALDRRSYVCGAVVLLIAAVLLLLCFPHSALEGAQDKPSPNVTSPGAGGAAAGAAGQAGAAAGAAGSAAAAGSPAGGAAASAAASGDAAHEEEES